MSHLETVLADADARIEGYKKTMALTIRAAGTGGGALSGGGPASIFSGSGPAGPGSFGDSYRELNQATNQLRAMKGWVYAAIRPIATRIAGQEIRVGHQRSRSGGAKATHPAGQNNSGPRRQKDFRLRNAPAHIKAISAESLDVLDTHPILDIFDNPNDAMIRWHLMWVTAATIQLTGKAFWWLYERNDRLEIWPTPPHWIRRNDRKDIWSWAAWLVQPPGSTDPWPVAAEDICNFFYPDPFDPNLSLSPLQTQATSVIIDEKIQQSQMATYDNAGRPGMLLKAGRVKDQMGKAMDQRHILTPEQRLQLVNAMKLAYSGVLKHGEPIIIDGLIEDAMPWTRSALEMDFIESERAKKERITQGFGVNSIVFGQIENANRASSAVADENFLRNVVNPLAMMISETATRSIGPRFSIDGQKLYIWIDEPQPNDEELELSKMEFGAAAGVVKKDEVREFLGLPLLGKAEGGEEFVEMKPQPVGAGAGGGAGAVAGASGSGKPAASGGKPRHGEASGGGSRRPLAGRGPAGGGGSGGGGAGENSGGRRRRGR